MPAENITLRQTINHVRVYLCVNEVNDVNDVVNTARGVKVIIIYLQLCLRIPHNAFGGNPRQP